MPLYDFHCAHCDKDFEEFKMLADLDEPEACPECGKSAIRQISAAALGGSLGGGGFHGGEGHNCAPSG
ncbi:MAG: zinc ribbon domain-containing protein [Deltaproteobacteria bacterium]|nr:zinc ribbon domain-containing protein [Deltaproteobacteria bacterium]